MKIKVTKKMTALLLTGALFAFVPACGISNEGVKESSKPVISSTTIESSISTIEQTIEPTIEPSVETIVETDESTIEPVETPEPDTLESDTEVVPYAYAINRTPIYLLPDEGSEVLGTFAQDRYFRIFPCNLENYYAINYYGSCGYVSKNDVFEVERNIIDLPMISKGYLPAKALIYDSKELDNPFNILDKLEFVEIYKEYDNSYLVETIDYAGYISKEDVKILEGTIAVIDRSCQEMRLYEGNDLTICTPVVTGTRNTSRESDLGLFQIHTKAKNLYIVPNYWVDCVAYYNGGEGIHTAEWRKPEDFGGDTYYEDGSHGCINTPHDEAMYMYDAMPKGTKVLVKE